MAEAIEMKIGAIRWWSGVVVVQWSRSMKLTYVGPGYYWDGWPCLASIPGAGHLSRYV